MISSRQAAVAAASLLSAIIALPPAVLADNNSPPAGNSDNGNDKKHNDKSRSNEHGERKEHGEKKGPPGQPRGGNPAFNNNKQGPSGAPHAGTEQHGMRPATPGFNKKPGPPENKTTGGPPPNNPSARPGNHSPAATTLPQKRPPAKPSVTQETPKGPPPNTFSKTPGHDQFKSGDQGKPNGNKHFGDRDKTPPTGGKPVVVNPGNPAVQNNRPSNFATPRGPVPPTKALSADAARKRFDNMRKGRKEKVEAGGKVVIQEPGNRTIIKQNNRLVIQHDETERLRRVDPHARFEKGKGGTNISIIDRPGNVKIYSETDAHGQLIRRYRRGPDGRDVIIIDNRRRGHGGGIGRDIATGVGIGLGVAAGAAILNSVINVPEPHVRIPRDQYIVEYDGASDEDVYDALSAPPVEDFSDRYTLDEIRATARLRDRMRRVDLDDINFEFGSWDVDPSEYGKLDRVARAMKRVIHRNPNEVFLIEGYTDAVGSPEDNLSLSDRRAESVAEVLSEQFQVPFENLTTQGYGEDYLKVQTEQPERLNRRVAVRRITPLLARGDAQPPRGVGAPPPGDRTEHYETGPNVGPQGDDGQGDDGGADDGGPDGGDQGAPNDGQPYQYSPYRGGGGGPQD
ncbi:MAG TPA: OmpA family protein [Hyphomicrobium sp.]|jgi:outer membrane protein OmpA-like peptidoglycan-associated protein